MEEKGNIGNGFRAGQAPQKTPEKEKIRTVRQHVHDAKCTKQVTQLKRKGLACVSYACKSGMPKGPSCKS